MQRCEGDSQWSLCGQTACLGQLQSITAEQKTPRWHDEHSATPLLSSQYCEVIVMSDANVKSSHVQRFILTVGLKGQYLMNENICIKYT